MKSANFTAIGLQRTGTAVIGLSTTSFVPRADGRTRGDQARAGHCTAARLTPGSGSLARVRDGADQGSQRAKDGYSWRDNDYFGARGLERALAIGMSYMDGYRQGYRPGTTMGISLFNRQYGQLSPVPNPALGVARE